MKFIKFFIYGILAAMGAMAVELVLSSLFSILFGIDVETDYFSAITFFLFLAVLTEEGLKLILLQKLYSSPDRTRHGIIPALVFGSGFGFFEIFSKSLSFPLLSSSLLGILLIHIATAGTIGYLLNKKDLSFFSSTLPAIFLPFLLHLSYNLLIIYDLGSALIGLYLAAIFISLLILKNKLAK
jgi:hypothetical protein